MNVRGVFSTGAVLALVLVLTACPKKKTDGADAAPEAATPAATAAADGDEAGASAATPLTPTPGATGAKPTILPKTDVDAGVVADAGVVMDAGPAAQECCCEVAGKPLASVAQSECTKGGKGACVKKERCAAAGIDAGALPLRCCCNAGGKKEIISPKECTKVKKGQCVKLAECSQ